MKDIIPNHVAIIPDGNRRWAREHGVSELEGHRKGTETAVKIARVLRNLGVHTFTLWGFSTENWGRQRTEVLALFGLSKNLEGYVEEAIRDEVKIIHLGRKDRLPRAVLKRIVEAERKTSHFKKHILNIAFDYGGRDEIIRAVKKINEQKFKAESINEQNFSGFLDTAGQPYSEPDLIIRTSGEMRMSGFMLWQAAYSEYLFLDKYFPDLSEEDIKKAIEEYARRKRRFGK